MAKKRASSGQPTAAKASRRRSAPATEQLDAIDQPDQPDATELARAFGVDAKAVKGVRTQDQLFSLVDVTMLVTGKDCNYAAQQIRFLRERHPEVNEKIINLKLHLDNFRLLQALTGPVHALQAVKESRTGSHLSTSIREIK